jgi:hypothetical protein
MTIGYKHRGDNGPLYHPERDFAYITPTLMRQAIENLEAPLAEDAKKWKQDNDITEAEIIAAAEALADAQRDFVNAADPVASLDQALTRHKWHELRYAVRQYVLAAIGEVILGAWFKAVREVSQLGEHSPAENEMCRFSGAVREFVARSGAPTIDPTSIADTVLFRMDVLQARLNATHTAWQQAKQAQHEAEMKATRMEIELSGLPKWARRFARWSNAQTDYTGPK